MRTNIKITIRDALYKMKESPTDENTAHVVHLAKKHPVSFAKVEKIFLKTLGAPTLAKLGMAKK